MINRIKTSMLYLIAGSEMFGVRFVVASTELLWGISLLVDATIFNNHPHMVLDSFLSPYIWSFMFICLGLVHMRGIFRLQNHDKLSVVAILGSSVLWWWLVVTSFIISYPLKTEIIIAISCSWLFVRMEHINKTTHREDKE